jgi:hypothetical protein
MADFLQVVSFDPLVIDSSVPGAAGPPGPAGPAGPQGPAGNGSAGVSSVGATDATIVVDGTAGNPTLRVGDLSATYAKATRTGAKAVGQGEILLNVMDFGFLGNGTSESTTALFAAINAVPAGKAVTVYFPAPTSFYRLDVPLPSRSYVTYRGDSQRATEIMWQSTASMLDIAAGVNLLSIRFENLWLQTLGGHLIQIASTGGLSGSTFVNCFIVSITAAASLVHTTGSATWQNNTFRDCFLGRGATATVSAFDLTTSAATISENAFENCIVQSLGATSGGPFFKFDVSVNAVGNRVYGLRMKNITGENNPAGLLYVGSPDGLTLEDVGDYDTPNYTGHLVQLEAGNSGGGQAPQRIWINNLGPRGQTPTYAGGKQHVAITSLATDSVYLSRIGDDSGAERVTLTGSSRTGPGWTGAWKAYTPAVTGALALGNGTAVGKYRLTGKTCTWSATITLGSTSVMSSNVLSIALPFTAVAIDPSQVVQAKALHSGFNWYQLTAYQLGSTTADVQCFGAGGAYALISATNPFTWASTDVINVGGTYEIA